MKLLALFLLLTLVISTIASDEPMRIGCFKHRVEAYFTGRVRDGAYECEFEHKQYPTPISFCSLSRSGSGERICSTREVGYRL